MSSKIFNNTRNELHFIMIILLAFSDDVFLSKYEEDEVKNTHIPESKIPILVVCQSFLNLGNLGSQ